MAEFDVETRSTSRTRSRASHGSDQRRSASAAACRSVARAIPHRIRTIEELALPSVIAKLADEQRGIVLVTGTTGSGKSTTLAAESTQSTSRARRTSSRSRIRIEFVHRDLRSVISQREVGVDTATFKRALRRRAAPGPGRDPDRRMPTRRRPDGDLGAETGHLVLSTIHTVARRSRSTGCSTSSRLTSTARCARCLPARCAADLRTRLVRQRPVGASPPARCCG